MRGLIITSVGTGIGKTLVTAILCHQLTSAGRKVRAIKPVVSGFSADDPASDPALILRSLGQVPTPQSIAAIAPWRLAAPISPHLAARAQGRTIKIDQVAAFCQDQTHKDDGLLLIEGAGGVMAPLDRAHTGLDLMARLGNPVILVTGSYLGALSHTLTALTALRERGIVVKGIVVSESEQTVGLADTVASLIQLGGAGLPVHALPRLRGGDDQKWRAAPDLMALCSDLDRIPDIVGRQANPARIMNDDWYEHDIPHAWLPYCQMQLAPPPLAVVGTHGCRIVLADGREIIDGIASWWSVCHGYNHPHIRECVARQLETMPHVMFGGLVHEPALRLARRLSDLTPPGLTRVFFSDSGSVAVEVALKIALQYWRNKGNSGKDRFLCFTDGYHGDTFGAMAISDPEKSMHKALRGALVPQHVVDVPGDESSLAELDAMLGRFSHELAGMIIEPLVQGAGGMRFHRAETVASLCALARKHNVLFIADEIATGFWRTGRAFASEEAGISPDILCLGKALTGGTIGMGATLASEEIFASFLSDDWAAALMHGPTFMANPLACAAANASLDLFEREPRAAQVKAIEAGLRSGLEPCRSLPNVLDVRVKGAIGVVQLAENVDVYSLRPRFVEEGVWVRPFKDIVYLMPPFVISGEELGVLTRAVYAVISAIP